MFVANKEYLKEYFRAFLFLNFVLTFFFILGVFYNSVIETLIIICAIMVFIFIRILYQIPILSKYFIENNSVVLKCVRLYKKSVSLVGAQTRSVELTMTIGSYAKKKFSGKYIIIANNNVDIDKVIYFAEKDLLKCLKEKGVLAIPGDNGTVLPSLPQNNNH